jgi:hypothetical protein
MSQYFFINKNSELPLLRCELIQDGRTDFHKFYLAIQNTNSVTFTMTNIETGIKKIAKAPAEIVYDEQSGCDERYFLQYTWKKRDTNEDGIFIGHFHINFNEKIVADGLTFPKGELIVPIQNDLIIQINNSTLCK